MPEVQEVPTSSVDTEATKARIDSLWSEVEKVQKDPELMSLFDRKTKYDSDKDPKTLLQEHNYPQRTKISDLKFESWVASLNQKFIKDGFMYLLRGDYPNLERKGFYSLPYGYGKKTTVELSVSTKLRSPGEVGYFLYGQEVYLTLANTKSTSVVESLAFQQSARGGSSFISTTTNLECAIAGTGNVPNVEEQKAYEVYVVRVPTTDVINSNTGNYFGMNEMEYLIPDYVAPDEIVAKFPRSQEDAIFEFMHSTLGISREDMGMVSQVDLVSPKPTTS